MKYFIASDIHGSAYWCRRLIEAYKEEKADRMVLLGDILYHGPRNDLPEEYDPRTVSSLLNSVSEDVICVRGNCDAEIDQMMLEFPILADYAILDTGNSMIIVTHGHVYNKENLPPVHNGDILLHGHTHVPACEETGGIIYMNPGSSALPKEGSWHGYMTAEDGVFTWKDLDGNVRMSCTSDGRC